MSDVTFLASGFDVPVVLLLLLLALLCPALHNPQPWFAVIRFFVRHVHGTCWTTTGSIFLTGEAQ
jgi:hypothetical protein